MGESFIGLPNRFKVINNLLESTYNPNHVLSAYQGYKIWENFDNYMTTTGGSLTGTLGTQDIIPISTQKYSLGTLGSQFNEVYAQKFFGTLSGNASSSTKWSSPMKLNITGSVTGSAEFDGSSETTINVVTNHVHDQYMNLSGGTLTGIIKLSKDAAFTDNTDLILLQSTSNKVLEIGYGPYCADKGATAIYSSGDAIIHTKSAGLTLTSDLYAKTMNIGASENSVYMANTEGNDFLSIMDDHTLQFNGEPVYHHGNFKPENLLDADYKDHINDVKKVIKVLTILVDQLEVSTGVKTERDYPEANITDQLEYYKANAIDILDRTE